MLYKHIQYKVRVALPDYQPLSHSPPWSPHRSQRPWEHVCFGPFPPAHARRLSRCASCTGSCSAGCPASPLPSRHCPVHTQPGLAAGSELHQVSHPGALPALRWVRSPGWCQSRSHGSDSQPCSPAWSSVRPAQSASVKGLVRISHFFHH